MMCVNTPVITGVFTHVAAGKARGQGVGVVSQSAA